MFFGRVLVLNLLFILTECLRYPLDTLPTIIQQPEVNKYALEGDKVTLPCKVQCKNCSEKVKVTWLNDEFELVELLDSSVQFENDALIICNYNSTLHHGSYFCKASYKNFAIRSRKCNLHAAVLPEFTISSTIATKASTAILKCVDYIGPLKNDLQFQWYKNGKLLQNGTFFRFTEEFLLIDDVKHTDSGSYSCHYKLKDRQEWYNSSEVHLNVTENIHQSPIFTYMTNTRNVSNNTSTTIWCITGGNPNTMVQIFQKSVDLDKKLVTQKRYAMYHIQQFTEDDVSTYMCEAELPHGRVEKNIKLDVVVKPELNQSGLVHASQNSSGNITFLCVQKHSVHATLTWYYNGVRIGSKPFLSINDGLLTISHLQLSHAGVYQCFLENQYGSDSRMFYLTVTNSGLVPTDLQVIPISPRTVKVVWKTTKVKPEKIFYKVLWTAPNGVTSFKYTKSDEFLLFNKLYGGLTYNFQVCSYYMWKHVGWDCIKTTKTMIELVPTKAPFLERPYFDRKVLKLYWHPIPFEYSMGIIQNYTVFIEQFYSNTIPPIETYYFNASQTQARIYLKKQAVYRIWMIATNNIGRSPKTPTFLASTDNSQIKGSSKLHFSAKWSSIGGFNPYLKWGFVGPNEIREYRIFYVKIPYNDYWREVQTITVNESVQSHRLDFLDVNQFYRFTLAPIYKEKIEGEPREELSYSQLNHVILHKNSNLGKLSKSKLYHKPVIDAPTGLSCLGTSRESLFVSWDPPKTNYVIQNYIVYVKNEKTGLELIYDVSGHQLKLYNLNPFEIWYAIRVHANNDELGNNVTFIETDYISCTTRVEAPSKPLNVDVMVIHDTKYNELHLIAKWKPPLYLSNSIYTYNIFIEEFMIDKGEGTVVPFEKVNHNVIMDRQYDDYIYSHAVHIKGVNMYFKLTVAGVNLAGRGYGAVFHSKTILRKPTRPNSLTPASQAVTTTTLKPKENTSHIKLGIVTGFAASAFFLLIFIVVCIAKEPCKQDKSNNNKLHSTYLYIQKLTELSLSPSSDQYTLSNSMNSQGALTDADTLLEDPRSCRGGYSKLLRPLSRLFYGRFIRRSDTTINRNPIISTSSNSCNYCNGTSETVDGGLTYCYKCQLNLSIREKLQNIQNERGSTMITKKEISSLNPSCSSNSNSENNKYKQDDDDAVTSSLLSQKPTTTALIV